MDSFPLPPPDSLELPFADWRNAQPDAIWDLLDSPKPVVCIVAPTGFGKSAVYMAYALLAGTEEAQKRVLCLTSTRSMQDQLSKRDFPHLGFDIRGQANYPCVIAPPTTVAEGMCHAGVQCELRSAGCVYYDAVTVAKASKIVFTNYSWYLHQCAYGGGIGPVDIMVCDEAHDLPEALASFLSVSIYRGEIAKHLSGPPPAEPDAWRDWAQLNYRALRDEIDHSTATQENARVLIKMKNLNSRLARLAMTDAPKAWIMEAIPGRYSHWRWDRIWPGKLSRRILFRETPKIVLVSATVRPKTLELLGLDPDDVDMFEYPSTFPTRRRPVIHFNPRPRVAVDVRATDETMKRWLARIDNIIAQRQDRKGVIHTVSYKRRDLLLTNSRFKKIMVSHSSENQAAVIQEFREADAPCVLVSPSVSTGIDFPFSECEYQIIAKVPFPDTRSKIVQARSKEDKAYGPYLAMLDLVQATGRGMRAEEDQCETFIVDDHWQWFRRVYRDFAPKWFHDACREAAIMPAPPKKLTGG